MKLYHYTDRWRARAILKRGLEARDPDFLSQPVGTYLTTDDRWGWFGDTVLEVDAAGLPLEPDPYYGGHKMPELGMYVVRGEPGEVVVPPQRIKVFREENLTPR